MHISNIVLLIFSALRGLNKQEVISHSFGFAVCIMMFKMFLLTGAFSLGVVLFDSFFESAYENISLLMALWCA